MRLERARTIGEVRSTPFLLPLTKEEIGLFLWKQQASEMDGGRPLISGSSLSRLSLDDWMRIPRDVLMEKLEYDLAAETRKAVVKVPITP